MELSRGLGLIWPARRFLEETSMMLLLGVLLLLRRRRRRRRQQQQQLEWSPRRKARRMTGSVLWFLTVNGVTMAQRAVKNDPRWRDASGYTTSNNCSIRSPFHGLGLGLGLGLDGREQPQSPDLCSSSSSSSSIYY